MKSISASLITLILGWISLNQTFAQQDDQAVKYVKYIDSLRQKDVLKHFFYPNKSACGGALHGFYLDDKLVYIEASNSSDPGYEYQRNIYVEASTVHAIFTREHVDRGTMPVNQDKDVGFRMFLTGSPKMQEYIGRKLVFEGNVSPEMMAREMACFKIMRDELAKQKEEFQELKRK